MDARVYDLAETLVDLAIEDGDLPKDISRDTRIDLIKSLGRDLQQTYEDFMEDSTETDQWYYLMNEPQCLSCGGVDIAVIGLEEGQLRLKCDGCLADWLEPNGPNLQLCKSGECYNWTPEGIDYCSQCIRAGWAAGRR